jgi:general secretion pathway protein N
VSNEPDVIIPGQSSPLRSLAAAALLCVGLAAALVMELTSAGDAGIPAPGAATVSSPPSVTIPKTPNRFTLPPLASFAEVTERPLFSSSRRPIAVDAPQSAERSFSATLAGIVISASSRIIIVSHGDPPVLTRLKEGDDLDGWSVTSIDPNRVLLRRDGVEQQLKLQDVPGRTAVAAPNRPQAAPGQAMAAAPNVELPPKPRH